ncbi:MAG: DUF47 family protein [Planctomycetes bacterium]|nr:DUF47 family protein [Planctomycetota bacterium]
MRQIGGFFGRSALGPLSEQMVKVRETVDELPGLFQAIFDAKRRHLQAVADTINRLEGQTDDIKDEIRGNLSRSFFSSVERSEILLLVKLLDAIADRCQDLAKFAATRPTVIPEYLQARMKSLMDAVVKSVHSLADAIAVIRELEEHQHVRQESARIEELLRQVALDEYNADQCQQDAIEDLFAHEDDIDAVSVFFILRLIEASGRVADDAENASDGFRRLFCTR